MTDEQWGRVDADGTVWVRTTAGERAVGQYPGATPEEALAYFGRKFDDLRAQVDLLDQRLKAGQVSAPEARSTVERLTAAVRTANAVGDLDGLDARLSGFGPVIEAQQAKAEQAKAQARQEALAARTALVDEAERIAATDAEQVQWKSAGDRLRELFESWRTLQRDNRLDRASEDELWRRFSHARTAFDRKRRAYFGALDEQRAGAKAVKEAIVAEAESLQTSTDWGPTAAAYRSLMDRWKAAGRAARKDDDALWARFRAAQDTFFAARSAVAAENEAEFRKNLEVKEALLIEAEALLPVQDLGSARASLRDIQDRWEAAGKVPRADLSRIEARLRRVEQSLRDAEQDRWRRSNPEARARAQGVVDQLESSIADLQRALDAAREKGDARRVAENEQAIAARQEWLAQARESLADFE